MPASFSLNGHDLGTALLTPTARDLVFVLPEHAQRLPESLLEIAIPNELRHPRTERGIRAVALERLELRPAGDTGPLSTPTATSAGLRLPPGSILAYAVRARPGATLRVRASSSSPRGRLETRLTARGSKPLFVLEPTAGGPEVQASAPIPSRAGEYLGVELRNNGAATLQLAQAQILNVEPPQPRPLPAAKLPGEMPVSLIIYLVDTLRADHLGAYGYPRPTSPGFDAFASQGLLFEDVWGQAPWTRPTVASIFTGLSSRSHGATGFDRRLPSSADTLAEILKRTGYRTGAFVANRVVNERFGFAQGFDVWNDGETLWKMRASEAVERALRFVDAGPAPFFLYLHTFEPHAPYEPSAESRAAFGASASPPTPAPKLPGQKPARRGVAETLALYDGEILDGDRAFQAFITGLESRGRLRDTLVMFTADHGEEFRDHGGHGHGHTLYRELIRVPLAVRLPAGSRAGIRIADAVAQIDLLPTLLSMLGAPAGSNVEGRDLSALWLGRAAPADVPELWSETRFGASEKSALRLGPFKLISNEDPRRYSFWGGPLELYDLSKDPAEQTDISAEAPTTAGYLVRRLRAQLERQAKLRRSLGGPSVVKLTDEEREELRALGYVE